jgi:glyoxylase-like metal-dependent hydrolase (beta-lactamase superfamily II)
MAMRTWARLLALSSALLLAACGTTAPTQRAATAQRLYVIDCGHGRAGDISRWTPGINVGQPRDFVDSCYLVQHRAGWLLWDTGVSDAVAAMPDGLRPPDPGATHWYRRTTLAAELRKLGLSPADIKYVAVSHSHPDHIGNLALFPDAQLLVQRAEFEWPSPQGPRFPARPVAKLLSGDEDVFGDGSVRMIATPGHTPGHQSLLVRLKSTGPVLLSGDAVHFRENWDARRVPSINADRAQTLASMDRIAVLLASEEAQLWMNHDKQQRDGLRLAPAFYD